MAKLSFTSPEGEKSVYKIVSHQVAKIGRDPGNDVILRDPKVSRHHAEIIFEKGFFVLRDLSSANGTYVNGRKIHVAPLTDGAEIRLGNSHGVFNEELSQPGMTLSAEIPRAVVAEEDEPDEPELPEEHMSTTPHIRASARGERPDAGVEAPQPASDRPEAFKTLLEHQVDPKVMAEERPRPDVSVPYVDSRFRLHKYLIDCGSASDVGTICDDAEKALFYFRRQRNLVGLIAGLVAAMIFVAGAVVGTVLFIEGRGLPGATALVLTFAFVVLVLLLVPKRHAVVCNDAALTAAALFLWQESRLPVPALRFSLRTPDNQPIAIFAKSPLSNLGRRRWNIIDRYGAAQLGYAIEDSIARALIRKVVGRFFRALETNFRVAFGGRVLAVLERRGAQCDVLNLAEDPTFVLDRRIAIGLAVLVDGIER
jgi:hypothetical protein